MRFILFKNKKTIVLALLCLGISGASHSHAAPFAPLMDSSAISPSGLNAGAQAVALQRLQDLKREDIRQQIAQRQASEMGRWQELMFTARQMNTVEGQRFEDRLLKLKKTNQLDDDEEIHQRVIKVFNTLKEQAQKERPTDFWDWKIHTTSHPDVEGLSMAGGRILIGSSFIRQLELSDGELAMLLGHEIGHALAEHQRETASEVKYIKPHTPHSDLEVIEEMLASDVPLQYQLARLSYDQEQEADYIGFRLAISAGYNAQDLVRFFEKMHQVEVEGLSSSAYPSAATRLSAIRGLEKLHQGLGLVPVK